MVRPLMTDTVFLAQKALPADANDIAVADDLLDTLKAHEDGCVGMAANMIGVNKRIIAVSLNGFPIVMLNPVIIRSSAETYEAEEGCLSLSGIRKAVRHRSVEVEFQDMELRSHRQTYTGFTAQAIQHELDHCEGILI